MVGAIFMAIGLSLIGMLLTVIVDTFKFLNPLNTQPSFDPGIWWAENRKRLLYGLGVVVLIQLVDNIIPSLSGPVMAFFEIVVPDGPWYDIRLGSAVAGVMILALSKDMSSSPRTGGAIPRPSKGAPDIKAGLLLLLMGFGTLSLSMAADIKIKIGENSERTPMITMIGTQNNHVQNHWQIDEINAKLIKYQEIAPWNEKIYRFTAAADGRKDWCYPPINMCGYHFRDWFEVKPAYPYQDIRLFMEEARKANAEPMVIINFGTAGAQEAADMVGYLNDPNHPLRQQYPHDFAPVKYFELGNEIPWNMVSGWDTTAQNPEVYSKRIGKFARAMTAASPTPIEIGAVISINNQMVGHTGMFLDGDPSPLELIIQEAGQQLGFFIFHGYNTWPSEKSLAEADFSEIRVRAAQELIDQLRAKYGITKPLPMANTESFTSDYSDETDELPDITPSGAASRSSSDFFSSLADRARRDRSAILSDSRSRAVADPGDDAEEGLFMARSLAYGINNHLLTIIAFCFYHPEGAGGYLADDIFWSGPDPEQTTYTFHVQEIAARLLGRDVVKAEETGLPVFDVPVVPPFVFGSPVKHYPVRYVVMEGDSAYTLLISNINPEAHQITLDGFGENGTYEQITATGLKDKSFTIQTGEIGTSFDLPAFGFMGIKFRKSVIDPPPPPPDEKGFPWLWVLLGVVFVAILAIIFVNKRKK